jgi:Tfp pilus assembly protein PilF
MAGGCCTASRIGGAAIAADSATKDGATRQATPQSKEWQTCSNGSAEPGIAACSTLIQTRMSGGKRLNSDDIGWAFGTRAFHYAIQGNYTLAMADVGESIRLRTPKNLMFAYYVRGLIYQNQSDHLRAIADFTKAVEINPKSDVAFAARAKSRLILGDAEHGNADYESAILARPDSRARYEMEKDFMVDWLQYLKEIQDAGDHANWSAPPLEAYRAPGG